MEKLFKLLMKLSSPRIPVRADLQAHFATGFIGGVAISCFLGFYAGVTIMATIAFAKEVYDYKHPNHTADFWDWVATVLGAILGSILGEVLWQVIVK
jgi:VanZ family protein